MNTRTLRFADGGKYMLSTGRMSLLELGTKYEGAVNCMFNNGVDLTEVKVVEVIELWSEGVDDLPTHDNLVYRGSKLHNAQSLRG